MHTDDDLAIFVRLIDATPADLPSTLDLNDSDNQTILDLFVSMYDDYAETDADAARARLTRDAIRETLETHADAGRVPVAFLDALADALRTLVHDMPDACWLHYTDSTVDELVSVFDAAAFTIAARDHIDRAIVSANEIRADVRFRRDGALPPVVADEYLRPRAVFTAMCYLLDVAVAHVPYDQRVERDSDNVLNLYPTDLHSDATLHTAFVNLIPYVSGEISSPDEVDVLARLGLASSL